MVYQRNKHDAWIHSHLDVPEALGCNRYQLSEVGEPSATRAIERNTYGISAVRKKRSSSFLLIATSRNVDFSPIASNSLTSVTAPITVE